MGGKLEEKTGFPNDIKCVILDLSSLNYIDASGVKTLQTVTEEIQNSKIEVLIATNECEYLYYHTFFNSNLSFWHFIPGHIFEQLKKYEKYDTSPVKFNLFPTIHDAVQFAYQQNIPISVMYENFAF